VITAATAVVAVGRTSNSRLCRSLLIVVGWPIFKERQWPSFEERQQHAATAAIGTNGGHTEASRAAAQALGNQVQTRDDEQRARGGGEPDPLLPCATPSQPYTRDGRDCDQTGAEQFSAWQHSALADQDSPAITR